MMRKPLLLSCAAALTTALIAVIGCDELVTQVNNNNVYDPTTGQQCVACHGDDDTKIRQPLGQWKNSRHASADLIEAHITLNGEMFLTSACGPRCHTSEGYKQFVSTDTAKTITQPSVIDCFTCHLPHTGTYGDWSMDTLRGDQATVDLGNFTYFSQNRSTMCAICHQAKHVPIFSSTPGRIRLDSIGADGPHNSAQANLIIGSGGALFGAVPDSSKHHRMVPDTMKGSCLTCHFGSGQGYDFGEHTFRLRNRATGEEFVDNCNIAACHDGAPAQITTLFDTLNIKLDSIRFLADTLRNKLLARAILTGDDNDTTEFNPFTIVPSDAGKILFNYLLYKKDGSHGIHNIDYTLQLLRESVARWEMVPKALMFPSDTLSCTGIPIDFVDSSFGDIATYVWDFDDGSPIDTRTTPEVVTHSFAKAGIFNVELTVSGVAGIDVYLARVIIDTIPHALFTIAPNPVSRDSVVKFTDNSEKDPTTWQWDFGDGVGTSTEQSPSYIYTTEGSYSVMLIAGNACGVDTLIDTIVVNPPVPPVVGRK